MPIVVVQLVSQLVGGYGQAVIHWDNTRRYIWWNTQSVIRGKGQADNGVAPWFPTNHSRVGSTATILFHDMSLMQ